MRFEIVNPVDPITIEASDPLLAAGATILLGKGRFALQDQRGDFVLLPFARVGASDAWLAKVGIREWDEWVDEHRPALARVLASAHPGTLYEHQCDIEQAEGDVELARERAEKRRSANDLTDRARTLALHLDDFGAAA